MQDKMTDKIKMVVCDMDGTLLRSDLSVSKLSLEAIDYLRKKKIIFTVATGRPDQLMKEYVDLLGLNDFFIMYNGTVVGNPFLNDRLYEKHLNTKEVLEIVRFLEKEKILYMVYTLDRIISKPHFRAKYFLDRNNNLSERQKSVIEDIEDLESQLKNHVVNKILVIEPDYEKFVMIKDKYEKKENLTVVMSQSTFLDINPSGTSKGKALSILADYYNIKSDEILVFGDQENDISMFEYAKYSVAMSNATKKVKDLAYDITFTNDDDGFARWVMSNI